MKVKKLLSLLLAASMIVGMQGIACAEELSGAAELTVSADSMEEAVLQTTSLNGEEEEVVLSKEELADKREVAAHISDLEEFVEGEDYIKSEVIFKASSQEEAEQIAKDYEAELLAYSYGVGLMELPEDMSVKDAMVMSADLHNDYVPVWPNNIVKATAAYSDPALQETSAKYQWQHSAVGSFTAWDKGYKGKGIKVAIVDSGVSPHEDLNIAASECFVENVSSTLDVAGHGTHVAGLVAAKLNGKGGAGIAPEASIYNARVMGDNGRGTVYDTIKGIKWAIEQKVDIINMSLGSRMHSGLEADACVDAYNAGIAVFAASGNDGSNTLSYPASYNHVISIGATQEDNSRVYFSNYGSTVDLCAPGYQIYSTYKDSSSSYTTLDGTSMACPVASGVAAVILGENKEIAAKTGGKRVDALESLMKKTATKCPSSGMGAGIVNVPKALGITDEEVAPDAPVFSVKAGVYETNSITVAISSSAETEIYYSTDGKAPVYKNGIVTNGTKYSKQITLKNVPSATLKAIAVSNSGLSSKVTSATYSLKPGVFH